VSTHGKNKLTIKKILIERLRAIRRLGGSFSSAFRKLQFWVRFPAGVQKNTYTTMTNAPEIPQATRLSTTETDIAKQLSTPRELCMDCYNWCTQEDVGENDFPQCGEGCHPETHNYLIGLSNTCPKHLVQ